MLAWLVKDWHSYCLRSKKPTQDEFVVKPGGDIDYLPNEDGKRLINKDTLAAELCEEETENMFQVKLEPGQYVRVKITGKVRKGGSIHTMILS
jgi:hypothetical protein